MFGLSGATGTVRVTVSWEQLSAESDPVASLHQRACSELSLAHEYNEHEVGFVRDDAVLKDSCRRAYLGLRKQAERIPRDEFSAKKKGKEFLAPQMASVPLDLTYTRPNSRGRFDRARVPG